MCPTFTCGRTNLATACDSVPRAPLSPGLQVLVSRSNRPFAIHYSRALPARFQVFKSNVHADDCAKHQIQLQQVFAQSCILDCIAVEVWPVDQLMFNPNILQLRSVCIRAVLCWHARNPTRRSSVYSAMRRKPRSTSSNFSGRSSTAVIIPRCALDSLGRQAPTNG